VTGRSVKEWIGASPDTPVPPHVRLRVFRAHDGICHIAKRKIRAGEPWDCDHVKALTNGGKNRESNLAPALRDKHRKKTAEDVAERAETDRMAKANLGIRKSKSGRKIPGHVNPWGYR
jgi:5-methylcytosine-specific restriction protein A